MTSQIIPVENFSSMSFEDLLEQPQEILMLCAIKGDTPPLVLAQLACHTSRKVRLEVAKNPATPPEVLALLSQDDEGEVIKAVAANLSTPREVLARIIEAGSWGHNNAAQNPNTPLESILKWMLNKIDDNNMKVSIGLNPTFSQLLETARKLNSGRSSSSRDDSEAYPKDFDFDVDEFSNEEKAERWG